MPGHYFELKVFKSERKRSKQFKANGGILFVRTNSELLKYHMAPMFIRVALQITVDAT
jgi:hypothetical protein